MTETGGKTTEENFGRELRSFFALCLLSLVFGSLAMAFGLQFIVTAALAMAGTGTVGLFPLVQVLLGWAAAVVGFRWILSSAKILKGVNRIRRDFRRMERPVPDDLLTGLIVRMMAHYRENWKTAWRMNLITILGGCIFLALGVANLLQGISFLAQAGPLYPSLLQAGAAHWPAWSVIFAFLGAAVNLAIGLSALISSAGFRRYARAWELRLIEAEHSEESLKTSMEQG